ncbi:MAG: ATPase domain-containing protein [Methanolinea sp.]|nr:ATPase domain-containing protein [Methanolinea sp.]
MGRENRRSTGISGLDLAMEGGFPAGSIIVVQGSPLTGIDLLARQFWSADGTPGTYLMIDADPEPGMTDARDVPPEGLPALMKGERVVLDSLSTIIARNGIDAALSLLSRAKRDVSERKANALFILYSDLHPVAEEIRIMRAADVIIELKEIIIMNEIERQLAVHKVRNAQVPKRLIPYNITEKGIELSTTSRVI